MSGQAREEAARIKREAQAAAEEQAKTKLPLHPRPAWAEGMDNTQGQGVRVDLATTELRVQTDEHDCSMYRLYIDVDSQTSVNVRFFFPPGNAGLKNAWIGLFRRESLSWYEEYGEVENGSAKILWKMVTSNEKSGVVRFGKLPKVIADGEYVFTLQIDYGVECRAASETITVRREPRPRRAASWPTRRAPLCRWRTVRSWRWPRATWPPRAARRSRASSGS